jgi:CubicO group peptidase (beta-lactamase class C family)
MDRRTFVSAAMAVAGGARFSSLESVWDPSPSSPEIDAFIQERMARYDIAGVAACLVKNDRMVWSNTYGFADLERQVPMSLDWVQNICSISKTFTTTALMQLWEQGRFQLDDDVSDYLSFPLRNPNHPDTAITFRLLLTHRSSIRDGEWYGRMYQCGDPQVSLGDWINGYLQPGGQFYDAQENFEVWGPGDRWEYNNVAFGLLGYLVERISGESFADYCQTHVFQPLEMNETSWYLADIDVSRHVVPYTFVENGNVRSPTWGGRPLGVILEGSGATVPEGDGHHASCAYNHPNFPDGFLRTSVRQLSWFARAYLNRGTLDGRRILEESTVEEMLHTQRVEETRNQGLTWYSGGEIRGREVWGHGGSDPGINTDIRLIPEERIAAIVFINTWGGNPAQITQRLLEEAPNF